MDRQLHMSAPPPSSAVNPPISAYIRTKNEARMIADVVAAALVVCDEVLVVDSGSTDGTVDIATAAGARVIHHEWRGFGGQKRIAEQACRHDWVLDIDGDEIVTAALGAEIRALFENGDPAHAVFRTPMAFAPPIGDPWIGFGGQVRHKLYNRRKLKQPDHPLWDQFDIPDGMSIGRLRNVILHHAWRDAGHLIGKLNSVTTTSAETLPLKSPSMLTIRIFFGFPVYFIKRYVFDGLFRGGVYGFAFSVMAAFGRWMRDVKMFERTHRERRPRQGGKDA